MAKRTITAKSIVDKYRKKLDIDIGTLKDMCSLGDVLLDTGSCVLNALISGSIYGGVPVGKMTGFYGPSGCGKSFIIGNLISDSIKKGFIPILVDTESAWTPESGTSHGFDIEECIVINEKVIEDIKNALYAIIKGECENLANGDVKFMLIIDSIGGLYSNKEEEDLEKNKIASDMGTRAKALKPMLNTMTKRCSKYGIPFVWANHIYDNPSQLHESIIKNMPGGRSPWFLSSTIVLMRRNEVKDEGAQKGAIISHSGCSIPMRTVKNRFVRPFINSEMYLDYGKGLDRYYGLFEVGKELGVIVGDRTYELVKQDGTIVKLGYRKNIDGNTKLWEEVIAPELDKAIKKAYSFGSGESIHMTQEEIEYIAELEEEEI